MTDSTGAVINQTQYKAWGEERYSSGAKQTNYSYTGQYSYESDFGLHFYNARWYDSSLGRFTQADSIVPAGVQGYDRYAAMENDPVRYTDPTGHMVSDGLGDGGGCDRLCLDRLGSRDEEASDRDEEENNVDAGDACKLLSACLNPESMNDLDGAETNPSGIEYVYDCEKTSCPILAIGAGLDFAEGGFIIGLSLVALAGACTAGSFIGCIAAAPGFLTLSVAGATLMFIGGQEIYQIHNPDYQIDELMFVHFVFPDFRPFDPK